jgi:hypothetical protein
MLLLAAPLLVAGGCWDFDALGGARDAGIDLGPSCMSPYDCADGFNCLASACSPAAADCAAQKQAFSAASDGVYWVAPSGPDGAGSKRVYCDMQLNPPATLCAAEATLRFGKTREGSNLPISFMSQFTDETATSCRIWAVQSDGFPLGKRPAGKTPDTCQSLGFAADGDLGPGCSFGSKSTNCGYTKSNFYCYGHKCDVCDRGQGMWDIYTFMGPFADGLALSSFAGDLAATCRTGLEPPLADR